MCIRDRPTRDNQITHEVPCTYTSASYSHHTKTGGQDKGPPPEMDASVGQVHCPGYHDPRHKLRGH
eukprot:1103419-Prorocentrum_lima.AAC.1